MPYAFFLSSLFEPCLDSPQLSSPRLLPRKEAGPQPNEEKDADALQRVAAAFGSAPEMKADSADPGPQLLAGDASGSGLMKPESMAADLAASFDPTAAAGAINAVIVPLPRLLALRMG